MFKKIEINGLKIWQATLFTLAYIALKFLLGFLILYSTTNLFRDSVFQIEFGEFLSALLTLSIILLIIKKIKDPIQKNKSIFDLKLFLLTILAVIGFRLAQDPFLRFENIFFGKSIANPNEITSLDFSVALLLKMGYIVFLIPITEELIFRKLIFKSLVKKYSSFWLAALVSSILFSITHLNFMSILPNFCLGLITAGIYYKTNKISFSMFFHILLNTLWFLIYYNPKFYWIVQETLNFGIIYWISVIMGFFILYSVIKKILRSY